MNLKERKNITMRTMFTSERISECISYQLPSSNWSNSYVEKNIRNSNKIVNMRIVL